MASSNGFTVLPTTGHSGTTVISITADSLTSMQERGVWVNITAGTLTKSVLAFQDNQQHYLTVSPQRINIPSSGGTTSFTISSDLSWSFVNPTSWAVFSTTSGNGTTTVTVTAPANTSVDNRSANFTVTALGLTALFVVNQPYPASFSITPTSITTTSGASSSYVTITSNSNWTITSIPNWVTASSTAGTGNDTVVFNISAFTSAGTRSGIVVFMCGGQTYRVDITQSGTSYFIPIPSSFSLPYNGGTTNLTISADCAWYVSSASSIVSLSQTAGTGNALITLTYPASTKKYQVSDTLVFTYNNTYTSSVTITQAANPEANPYILFSPDPLVLNSSSGTSAFTIASNTVWTITSKPSFVSSYSPTSGTGDTSISISYGQNLSAEELVGYFTVTADSISSMLETKQKGKYAYFDRHYIYDNLASGMSNITPVGVSSDTSWYMSRESHTGSSHSSQSSKLGTSSGSVTSDYINSNGSRTIYVKNAQPTGSTDTWCYDVYTLSVAGTVVDRLYVGRNAVTLNAGSAVPASGGTTTLTVTFKGNGNGPWFITCESDIPQFSATAGTGTTNITVTLPEWSGMTSRSFKVTLCDLTGVTATIVQQPVPIWFNATPSAITFDSTGGSRTVLFTTNAPEWYVFPRNIAGSYFAVSPTSGSTTSRTLTITTRYTSDSDINDYIAANGNGGSNDQLVKLTLPADKLEVSPTSIVADVSGATRQIQITASTIWHITNLPDWISASSVSGTGDTTITLTILQNTGVNSRVYDISITTETKERTIRVTQNTVGEGFMISPSVISFPSSGGTQQIRVNTKSVWTASAPNWLSLSQSANTGDTVITVTASAGSSRTGTITFTNGIYSASVLAKQTDNYDYVENGLVVFHAGQPPITGSTPVMVQAFIVHSNTTWTVVPLTPITGRDGTISPTEGGSGTTVISAYYPQHFIEDELSFEYELRDGNQNTLCRFTLIYAPTYIDADTSYVHKEDGIYHATVAVRVSGYTCEGIDTDWFTTTVTHPESGYYYVTVSYDYNNTGKDRKDYYIRPIDEHGNKLPPEIYSKGGILGQYANI